MSYDDNEGPSLRASSLRLGEVVVDPSGLIVLDFANLIQEQRTAIRKLQSPNTIFARAGEGAAEAMALQFELLGQLL